MTFGYSPVMIEHLFDEALVWALRRGADALDWHDIQQAKMTEEIGLKQPVEYTEDERRTIATHEAGHATVAYLVGKDRKLEVLSIIKRKDALGLLAHSDLEERFTKTRSRRSSPSSRSPWAAWWPRSCSSARPAPARPATCRRPRRPRPRWSARSAWPAR